MAIISHNNFCYIRKKDSACGGRVLCEVPIETIEKSFVTFVNQKLLDRLLEKELNGKLHQTVKNHFILLIENAL